MKEIKPTWGEELYKDWLKNQDWKEYDSVDDIKDKRNAFVDVRRDEIYERGNHREIISQKHLFYLSNSYFSFPLNCIMCITSTKAHTFFDGNTEESKLFGRCS